MRSQYMNGQKKKKKNLSKILKTDKNKQIIITRRTDLNSREYHKKVNVSS